MSCSETAFVRIENEKIGKPDFAFGSLDMLGMYGMLSGILSNPAFTTAHGGFQHLLSLHCKNGAFSLHGTWKKLCAAGYLKRTRIPTALNEFNDYYTLLSVPDTAIPAVRNLSVQNGKAFLAAYSPFATPTDDFTAVSYAMLLDSRLSLGAKGLYMIICRLLRLAVYCDDLALTKEVVFHACKKTVGQNAFDSLWRELRENGYLTLTRIWDREKQKSRYRYELSASPVVFAKEPLPAEEAVPEIPKETKAPAEAVQIPETGNSPIPLTQKGVSGVSFERSHYTNEDLRELMEYSCLTDTYPRGLLDAVLSVYREFANGNKEKTIRIGKEETTVGDVWNRLSALGSEDLRFALDRFRDASKAGGIRNERSYLTVCLYHAKENLALALESFLSNVMG